MRLNVKLFLISLLCLSASIFGFGLNSISYADERVKEKVVYVDDCDYDFSRDFLNDFYSYSYSDLPTRNNTRSISEFSNYYSNFTFDDMSGNNLLPSFTNLTTFSSAKSYIQTITGNSFSTLGTSVTITLWDNNDSSNQFFWLVANRIGSTTNFIIGNIVINYSLSGYNNLRYIRIETSSRSGSIFANFTIYEDNSLSSNNISYSEYCYSICNVQSNLSYNNFFSIDNGLGYLPSLFYIVVPSIDKQNYDFTFDFNNLYFSFSSPSNVIRGISVNSYQRTNDNIVFPITIPSTYTQTISLSSSDYSNGYYTFSENDLTVPYGVGYVLYFSVQCQFGTSSADLNSEITQSLPFLFDYGEVPPVVLSTPVISLSDNNMLEWSSVANADYYKIKRVSDGQTYYIDNYTYTSYVLSVNGLYSVQACSYNESVIFSDYSNTITIDSFADTEYSFLLLISAIMDSILLLFKSFLNYNVLGVNMFGAFGVILFILLILAILKFIRSK